MLSACGRTPLSIWQTVGHLLDPGFEILAPNHPWVNRWMARQYHLPGFPYNIPAMVTPQDCRYLFRLESLVARFPMRPQGMDQSPTVLVAGYLVDIRWDHVADGDYVCSPL